MSSTAYDFLAQFYRQLLEPRGHFAKQAAVVKLIIEQEKMPLGPRLLDASCGTGDVAALLFESGFRKIEAIDGSQAMIDHVKADNPVSLKQVHWIDLPRHFEEHGTYDLIFILGNSLAHSPLSMCPPILSSLYEGLNAGGVLLLDLRVWESNAGNLPMEPGRQPSVHRCLGKVDVCGQEFLVYDNVEYENRIQHVVYRLELVGQPHQGSGAIEEELTYHIFDHQQVTELLLKAGFQRKHIETRSFPEWPYLVIMAAKK